MNVIWIVSDTFRRDHVGAYGNQNIRTPSLGRAGGGSSQVRRLLLRRIPDNAHTGGPSDGALDDVFHGMGAASLRRYHTGRDTGSARPSHGGFRRPPPPYYLRDEMNYDRGFQSFFMNRGTGQTLLWSLIPQPGYHNESLDVRAAWRNESEWISCVRPRRRHGWNFGCRAVEVLTVSISVASWYRVSTDGGGWGRLPRGRPHLWQPLS